MKHWVVLALLFVTFTAGSAVRISTHQTYAVRKGTAQLATHTTLSACQTDARARLEAEGTTRTSGSAVYTCIGTTNYIGTFYVAAPAPRTAILNWQHTGATEGFRVVYGTSATALPSTIQIANPTARTYTVTLPAAGTYFFAVKAYNSGLESDLSNVVSKTVQ